MFNDVITIAVIADSLLARDSCICPYRSGAVDVSYRLRNGLAFSVTSLCTIGDIQSNLAARGRTDTAITTSRLPLQGDLSMIICERLFYLSS